jgi:hypothetical protein
MIERIVRAIRLDWTVFREIAKDPKALKEAAIIVAISTFLSAMGLGLFKLSFGSFIVDWLIAILVGWIGWAVITYLVGTAVFKAETDIPEMLRVLGYANAPLLLGLLSFIPCVGWLFPILAGSLGVGAVLLSRFGTRIYPDPMRELAEVEKADELPPSVGDEDTSEPIA